MWVVVLLAPLFVILALLVMSATARRPKTLGVRDGRLAPLPDSPNCVSTQAEREQQGMAPIPIADDSTEAFARLREVIMKMPRARIVSSDETYLHAEFTSALFRFVDDVECFVDHERKVIHFRSASRVGRSDLGVNRQRMQSMVAAYKKAVAQEGLPKTDR